MTRVITKYDNLDTAEIRRLLDQALNRTNSDVRIVCSMLYVLAGRGERHPYMTVGQYGWYREVAENKLHAAVLPLFHHKAAVVKLFMTMPLDKQYALAVNAREPETPVVSHAPGTATAVVQHKPLASLLPAEAKRVLGPEGVKPVEAQIAALPRPKTAPEDHILVGKIKLWLDTRKVDSCGKVDVEDLIPVLERMGYLVKVAPLGKKRVA